MPRRVWMDRFARSSAGRTAGGMMHFSEPIPNSCTSDALADHIRLAAAAYLGRFKGSSPRAHRVRPALLSHLVCRPRPGSASRAARGSGPVHPVDARGPPVQAVHGVAAVLGGRRVLPDLRDRRSAGAFTSRACPPPVSAAGVATLGFTHLQFEAMLTAARESANRYDFALVAMLGLLGRRIFEATGADIGDLGEEHGHRVLRVCGKGGKVVLVPLPPAVGRAIDRAIAGRMRGPILLNSRGARMDRHAATRRLRQLADRPACRSPGRIPTCSGTLRDNHAGCRGGSARCPDRRPARRSPDDHAV